MSEQPPSGWYPDPGDPDRQRYWDGTQWSDHTAAAARSTPPPTGGTPPQEPASWPGQHPGQQPGYGSPGLGGDAPDPWMWQSIVTAVLCCIGGGISGIPAIVGIVFASQSQSAAGRGDLAEATRKARAAKGWTIASLVLGVVLIIAFFALGLGTAFMEGFNEGLDGSV